MGGVQAHQCWRVVVRGGTDAAVSWHGLIRVEPQQCRGGVTSVPAREGTCASVHDTRMCRYMFAPTRRGVAALGYGRIGTDGPKCDCVELRDRVRGTDTSVPARCGAQRTDTAVARRGRIRVELRRCRGRFTSDALRYCTDVSILNASVHVGTKASRRGRVATAAFVPTGCTLSRMISRTRRESADCWTWADAVLAPRRACARSLPRTLLIH